MIKKSITLIVLLLCFQLLSGGEIKYPESFMVIDTSREFKLLIGSTPRYVNYFYGEPSERELLFEAKSPQYEIWKEVYQDGFSIIYDTYDNIITRITITSSNFLLDSGLTINSTIDELIECYGDPMYQHDDDGYVNYYYEFSFPEISTDDEYNLILFKVKEGKVKEIEIEIATWV